EQNLIPFCTPIYVLSTIKIDSPNVKIFLNKEYKYNLIVNVFFDSLNETFIINKRNVLPNRIVELSFDKNEYALIKINAYDNNMLPVRFYCAVYNSSFYQFVSTAFYGNGSRNFYITPGNLAFVPTIYINNKQYKFAQESLKLDKKSVFTFSYGGKLEPKLKVLLKEDILCPTLKGKTQIFIETKDNFGNLLMYYSGFKDNQVILKLLQNNKLIYEKNLSPDIALYGEIIDKELDINNPTDYQIDLDLGVFGLFKLTGKLFSEGTKVEYETIYTDNFIINYPKGYKDKFVFYGEFVERVNKAFSQILGIKIDRKTTINLFFGNITGVSTKGRFDAGAAEIFNNSIYQISGGTILIALHEHAHSYQFEPEEPYEINDLFGEAICDITASYVYEYLWGHPAKLWKLGGIQPFLYKAIEYIEEPSKHPINLSDPYDTQTSGNMRFILRYLETKYGEDIHKKFIECWSMKISPFYIPKTVFENLNMNDYEKICSIYSYIVGENIGEIFNYMGFNVNKTKIDQFLKNIKTKITDTLPPFLVIYEPKIIDSEEIFTNTDSIKISGRTEKGANLYVGDKKVTVKEDGSFETIISTLFPGINTVVIESKDTVGNSISYAISVMYDNEPPEINIEYPPQNIFTNKKEIEIRGIVSDKVSKVRELKINDDNVIFLENGYFSKNILLSEGENNIKIVAVDFAGNKKEELINIYIDTFAPEIFVSLPNEVNEEILNISGYVKDQGISGIKDFSILINGIKIELSRSLTFSYELRLNEGENIINFEIEDNAGNKSTKKFTVRYLKKIEKVILKLQIGNKTMYVNNSPIVIDVPPIIIEGRTLLPIRWIAEPLGAQVDWNESEKKVTVILMKTIIELWIGKNIAKVNGIDTQIDPNNNKVVPMIISGRTMMPLRFVAENLGCEVLWDSINKIVTIIYPKE
ncbi:MAG: stalk domain-containing protein, partial [Thermoplasmata archaeon]